MNDQSTSAPPNSQTASPLPPYTPHSPYSYPYYKVEEGDVRLRDAWRIVTTYRLTIFSISALATIVAIVASFLMAPVYRAEVLLAPVSDEERTSISALALQFGGLASLAGIDLGPGDNNVEQSLATIRSRQFIRDFVADKQLMPLLYRDKWNAEERKWKDPQDVPSTLDAYQLLIRDVLSINADKKTGLVTLIIDWNDPDEAAEWANSLVRRINVREKEMAISEAEKSISYLRDQLVKTSVVEMQQAIYQLMEAQSKKIMIANVREEYAFKVIDPAVPPEHKIKPKRALIALMGLLAGVTLGFFVATFLDFWKKNGPLGKGQAN